jgi:thiol-disulfide isomerase/thioredoxin
VPRLRRLRPRHRLAAVLGAALAGSLLLGSCSGADPSSDGSGETGYVAGKGVITTLPAAKRERPAPVRGETLDGRRIALSDHAGSVVVVNVWGSWCAPCRAEAPLLARAARHFDDRGVVFLGIDSRDLNQAAARAFQRHYDVPYPSIYDPSGRTLLAFHGTLPPNAIPSTVIIDRQGRVAARVLGEISKGTLYDLVEEVAGGSGATARQGKEGT